MNKKSYRQFVNTLIRLLNNQYQYFIVVLGRMLGVVDFPVPPNSSMRKTSSVSIRHYYTSSIQTSLPIVVSAIQQKVKLDKNIRILDFGCGVGRQLLHFTRHFPDPDYYACDVDDTSIAFIKRGYRNVHSYTSSFNPPLKYETGFFDMVYSLSIFSHLGLEDQQKWLSELSRITRSGGYCFLTTEGFTALESLASNLKVNAEKLKEDLKQAGILYREYKFLKTFVGKKNTVKVVTPLVGIEGTYGNTMMSPDYIRKEWSSDKFDVMDVIEGVIDYRQDLVVLRRK